MNPGTNSTPCRTDLAGTNGVSDGTHAEWFTWFRLAIGARHVAAAAFGFMLGVWVTERNASSWALRALVMSLLVFCDVLAARWYARAKKMRGGR